MNRTALIAASLIVLLPSTNLLAYQSEESTTPAPAPSAQAAEGQPGSMVYTAGNATIDGSAVGQSSPLLDGAIFDSGTGAATITRKGSTVMLGSNSRVALAQNNLRLGCGTATIKTVNGLSTLAPGYGVTPSGLNARYQLLQTADHLQVSALEGDLWVFMGNRQVTVPAGQSISVPGECVDANALKSSLPGATPTTPGVGPGVGGTVASGKISKTIIIATAGALGGGAILACVELCGGSKKPVSPAAP